MEPKPLSEKRREEIQQFEAHELPYERALVLAPGIDRQSYLTTTRLLNELIAAERYWRETVANAESAHWCSDGRPLCNFHCTAVQGAHVPDCPWLLAKVQSGNPLPSPKPL